MFFGKFFVVLIKNKALASMALISVFFFSVLANPFNGKCERWFVPSAGDFPIKYFNSAEDACKDLIMRFYSDETWKNGVYTTSDQYSCVTVEVGNRTSAERAVRDDCCSREVLGPYSDIIPDTWKMKVFYKLKPLKFYLLTMYPLRGLGFGSKQRENIFDYNIIDGVITSDVNDLMIPGVTDYCTDLFLNDSNDDCSAQIHHIVPRKDSKGCDCGKNSYKNALVISRKLNGEISNDCNNPKLKAIMDFFTPQMNVSANANEISVVVKSKPRAKTKQISTKLRVKVKKYVRLMQN